MALNFYQGCYYFHNKVKYFFHFHKETELRSKCSVNNKYMNINPFDFNQLIIELTGLDEISRVYAKTQIFFFGNVYL